MAESQAGKSWRDLDIPSNDGAWQDIQLVMTPAGVVILAATLRAGYGGPPDGDGHVFAFIGR